MKKQLIIPAILLMLTVFLTSCKEDPVTPVGNNVSVSYYTDHDAFYKSQADTLIIDSVKILIKSIKLKPSTGNDSTDIKTGPFVVNLSANNTLHQVASNSIPAGTYDRVRFKIHKPEANESFVDTAFFNGTSEDRRFSVIVKGKFNGVNFVYRSKKSADQSIVFETPVTIGATGNENLTLLVNPYAWFKSSGGWMNPDLSANENDIDNNIKTSFFRAYKDNNKDGRKDN
ncbi:MAG: hypothetical protein AMXMBFR48_19630 [Ignavibacteriales bacterium]